jgi:hypothetical protein
MASGVGMIAYKGRSKLEDYALNFAGVNAFFVALWLGLAVGIPLVLAGMPYSVLVVEVWEILLFIAFWLVATRTEWVVQDGTAETRV